jgi:hypothetical protein
MIHPIDPVDPRTRPHSQNRSSIPNASKTSSRFVSIRCPVICRLPLIPGTVCPHYGRSLVFLLMYCTCIKVVPFFTPFMQRQ